MRQDAIVLLLVLLAHLSNGAAVAIKQQGRISHRKQAPWA